MRRNAGVLVEATLLDQGVTLMLVGMGTVFVFLTVLVVSMSILSALMGKLAPPAATDLKASEEEVAAITAAIVQHRKATSA